MLVRKSKYQVLKMMKRGRKLEMRILFRKLLKKLKLLCGQWVQTSKSKKKRLLHLRGKELTNEPSIFLK